MRNNVLIIIKKELARFFGDRRLMLSAVLLPGIMIYVMYTFMGDALSGMLNTDESYKYTISVVNMPESFSAMAGNLNADFTVIGADEIEARKIAVSEKKEDLLVLFPENFDALVAAYDTKSGEKAPQVSLYYNTTRTESTTIVNTMTEMLDAYESSLANKFDINAGGENYNLATEKDTSGFMFSSMLPMLLMIFLFTGCMAIAPESIAGEKERGTIATMLITPVKRSELVMGKIIALAIVALLSGASSTVGTLLSLPKMTGAIDGASAAFYSPADYIMLAAVILSTVLLFVSIISIISAFAKTIKEAQTSVAPLMIVVVLIGITGLFTGKSQSGAAYYLIPVYNSVQSMVGIFSFEASMPYIIITVAVNLILSTVCGFVLTKMFNSEKIMFNK